MVDSFEEIVWRCVLRWLDKAISEGGLVSDEGWLGEEGGVFEGCPFITISKQDHAGAESTTDKRSQL